VPLIDMLKEAVLRTGCLDAATSAAARGDLDPGVLAQGVRVSKLVRIRIADVDLDSCRIRITQGKGGKDRVVPFPAAFKETLALHIDAQRRAGAVYLFESSWKKPYSDRGVRKILTRYTQAAGITASISPHTLRHFLLTLAQDPGHRRRAHPALQRPRHPPVPGDLLPPRPGRRPAALRRRHRRLPRLTSAITLVWAW
jgi:integrase